LDIDLPFDIIFKNIKIEFSIRPVHFEIICSSEHFKSMIFESLDNQENTVIIAVPPHKFTKIRINMLKSSNPDKSMFGVRSIEIQSGAKKVVMEKC